MGDFNHTIDSIVITNFLTKFNSHKIHNTFRYSFNPNIPTHDRGSKATDVIFAPPDITA